MTSFTDAGFQRIQPGACITEALPVFIVFIFSDPLYNAGKYRRTQQQGERQWLSSAPHAEDNLTIPFSSSEERSNATAGLR
jgi:hypothetical protein